MNTSQKQIGAKLYDIELERNILDLFLSAGSIANVIQHYKSEEIFFLKEHQQVFICIKNLHEKADSISVVTVFREAQRLGFVKITAHYLGEITMSTQGIYYNDNAIMQTTLLLKELWVRRVLSHQSVLMAHKATDLTSDVFETMNKLQMIIHKTNDYISVSKSSSMADVMLKVMDKDYSSGKCIPSGLAILDKTLGGGFWNGTLTVIAGRSGTGKTAVSIQLANNICELSNVPIAFFSLEMSQEQLAFRQWSNLASLPSNLFKIKDFKEHELPLVESAYKRLGNIKMQIDDNSGLTINELKSKAHSLFISHNIGCIIVDYLQIITPTNSSIIREQQIAQISRELKKLSRELNIPVIALAQVSKDIDKRPDKRPMLSDLRESAAIENDADNILFLYRPEKYQIDEDITYTETNGSTKDILEIIVAKNRDGLTGRTLVSCKLGYNQIYDLPTQAEYFSIPTIELPNSNPLNSLPNSSESWI